MSEVMMGALMTLVYVRTGQAADRLSCPYLSVTHSNCSAISVRISLPIASHHMLMPSSHPIPSHPMACLLGSHVIAPTVFHHLPPSFAILHRLPPWRAHMARHAAPVPVPSHARHYSVRPRPLSPHPLTGCTQILGLSVLPVLPVLPYPTPVAGQMRRRCCRAAVPLASSAP